jgi:hypothetical protein
MNRPFYNIVGALPPELQPQEAPLVQKALLLHGPDVAMMPGTAVPDPLSVRYQHGWVDGVTEGAFRGLLAGVAVGSVLAWLITRKR